MLSIITFGSQLKSAAVCGNLNWGHNVEDQAHITKGEAIIVLGIRSTSCAIYRGPLALWSPHSALALAADLFIPETIVASVHAMDHTINLSSLLLEGRNWLPVWSSKYAPQMARLLAGLVDIFRAYLPADDVAAVRGSVPRMVRAPIVYGDLRIISTQPFGALGSSLLSDAPTFTRRG